MKCWNPLFNAQGSKLILVVIVRVGEVEIYVAAMEALRQKERQDETQFTTKIDGFLNFKPNWMLMYLFAAF
jgi:cell shape-determining protein MreD